MAGGTCIHGLVVRGILSVANEYRPGLSKLVPAGEVRRFAEHYVDATVVAERSNATIHWVNRCLRESAMPILEISVSGKGQKLFLHRELAANVRIPHRRTPRG